MHSSDQRTLAAMLYAYASTERLERLRRVVTQYIESLADPVRPFFFQDLQKRLEHDIAGRMFGEYRPTATDECLRAAEQSWMTWMGDAEEARYEATLKLINHYAGPIDNTLCHPQNRWDDYGFMYHYPGFLADHPARPVFRIRSDIVGETGKPPPATGVYVSVDDPQAALQFAWSGKSGCLLRPANTFNALGLDALPHVGGAGLWSDESGIFEFATRSGFKNVLRPPLEVLGTVYPEFAPSAVARAAFEQRPSSWYLVEQLDAPRLATALRWPDEAGS